MMSRRAQKSSKKTVTKANSVPSQPIHSLALHWILGLPRLVRFLIVGVFGIAVTVASSPLVDNVYLQFLYTEQTRMLPALVSVGLGVVMYMLGWWLLVGTTGEAVPPRNAVLWYVGVGILAVCLVIVLILNGYSLATAPTI